LLPVAIVGLSACSRIALSTHGNTRPAVAREDLGLFTVRFLQNKRVGQGTSLASKFHVRFQWNADLTKGTKPVDMKGESGQPQLVVSACSRSTVFVTPLPKHDYRQHAAETLSHVRRKGRRKSVTAESTCSCSTKDHYERTKLHRQLAAETTAYRPKAHHDEGQQMVQPTKLPQIREKTNYLC